MLPLSQDDDDDEPASSQLAISHLAPTPSTAKRPRRSLRPHMCLSTKVSPSKPPRGPSRRLSFPNFPLIPGKASSLSMRTCDTVPVKASVEATHKGPSHDIVVGNSAGSATHQHSFVLSQQAPNTAVMRAMALDVLDLSARGAKGSTNSQVSACLPDEADIPSPPASISEWSEEECESGGLQNTKPAASPLKFRPIVSRHAKIIEDFAPSVISQDSEYFSFPLNAKQTETKKEEPVQASSSQPFVRNEETSDWRGSRRSECVEGDSFGALSNWKDEDRRKPYYTRAFDYVLTEVLKRYSDVLRPYEVELVRLIQAELSINARSLFVRIYKRKQPSWYCVETLQNSYGSDIFVEEGINELFDHRILASTVFASKAAPEMPTLIAKEVISGMSLQALKSVCSSTVESLVLKKSNRYAIVLGLKDILSNNEEQGKKKEKFTQTTLSGISSSDRLAKAVLKSVGHAVKIPAHILVILKRVHFLFFLEDGHDSPNIILADTGKVQFPLYLCEPENRIFPSAWALESYENAITLETELNDALESKDYVRAADFGSVAELEIRQYIDDPPHIPKSSNVADPCKLHRPAESSVTNQERLNTLRSGRKQRQERSQLSEQLRHPFFRRYTSQWVYVRAAWHSVHALERLAEYENAIERLQLLLTTNLIPKRRGKCLNRLTINLFKHLGKLKEPLNIIIAALGEDAAALHFGDRMDLVNRGIAIHRKLNTPEAEKSARSNHCTKAQLRKTVQLEIASKIPFEIRRVMIAASARIAVRKIFGISRQVAQKKRRHQRNPWLAFTSESSLESVASAISMDSSAMGKSVFFSLGSNRRKVSVEEYCLEWYLGKDGWQGIHDEGCALRFLFCLLLWDSGMFAPVQDVFQTPYQDRPLDLFTEAFYPSRKASIDNRLAEIQVMQSQDIRELVLELYEKHELTRAVGCAWKKYSAVDLSIVAAGFGGKALSHCCKLLAQDYSYWGGGLPDLTLWKIQIDQFEGVEKSLTKLVEVKSARDTLSERQRAWLIEMHQSGVICEVCKVVERITAHNAADVEKAQLDLLEINAIDVAIGETDENG